MSRSLSARKEAAAFATAKARDALNAGAMSSARPDHVGDLVWWDPTPGWMADCYDVDRAWRDAGFDSTADLPVHTDHGTAFSRAVDHVRGTLTPIHYVLKLAAPVDGDKRVAIVRESRNGRYTSEDQGTVRLPSNGTGPIIERVETNQANDIADQIIATENAHHWRYTSDDVRNAVTRIIERWAGLPCRQCPPHVVYWLPSPASDTIRRLADLVERLGWGQIHLVAAYRSDVRSLAACQSAATQGLDAQLSAFAREAEAYAVNGKVRASTIETRLTEAKALRERGELYRAILGAAVSSVDDRIAAIESSLRDTLANLLNSNVSA